MKALISISEQQLEALNRFVTTDGTSIASRPEAGSLLRSMLAT